MALSFRDRLLITAAINTVLEAINDPERTAAIAAPIAKVVAAGAGALVYAGCALELETAFSKAGISVADMLVRPKPAAPPSKPKTTGKK